MKARAQWAAVKTDWTKGVGIGIIGEGHFDVEIDSDFNASIYKEAEVFLRQFNSKADITEIEDGAFEMYAIEDDACMGYVFRVLEYDTEEGKTFSHDELRTTPVPYSDEHNRRWPREKWLKSRGYEQQTGSMFRLRIAILHDHKEPQYIDHWVGMDTVAMMSLEELEEQDRKFWVKVEVGKTYEHKRLNDAYAKVTKLVFEKDVLRIVEFTNELGEEHFMGIGLFECEYEKK